MHRALDITPGGTRRPDRSRAQPRTPVGPTQASAGQVSASQVSASQFSASQFTASQVTAGGASHLTAGRP